jgi:hypothetical protein
MQIYDGLEITASTFTFPPSQRLKKQNPHQVSVCLTIPSIVTFQEETTYDNMPLRQMSDLVKPFLQRNLKSDIRISRYHAQRLPHVQVATSNSPRYDAQCNGVGWSFQRDRSRVHEKLCNAGTLSDATCEPLCPMSF